MKALTCAILTLLVAGCTSSRGFDRGALRTELGQQREVTEEEIQKALAARPQLAQPFTLALYFAPPPRPQWRDYSQWIWTGEDKDRVLRALEPLRADGAVSELVVIPQTTIEGTDNKAVRLAAARVGASAVLMIKGTADLDRYNNPLGALYILIVTAFFIPGTETDSLFLTDATLWDVGNGFVYLGVEAEGLEHRTAPAIVVNERHIIDAAKAKALDALATDVGQRIGAMAKR